LANDKKTKAKIVGNTKMAARNEDLSPLYEPQKSGTR